MITQLPLTGPFPFSHSSVPNDRCMHHAHRRRESEENVAFPLKEIFLPRCLHCNDTSPLGPTKPRPTLAQTPRQIRVAVSDNLPVRFGASPRHRIGFRPDTFVTPIDRVRRGARSFRQPNHGRVSHRFHSVTNSIAAAATGVISESVCPSIRRPGNGNGSDFRLSGRVEVHTQSTWPAMQ